MPDHRVLVKVIAIEGKCPIYTVGDEWVVDRQEIDLHKMKVSTGRICAHVMGGLAGSIMAIRGGPVGRTFINQCIDPGPPYVADGGRVVFEVRADVALEEPKVK